MPPRKQLPQKPPAPAPLRIHSLSLTAADAATLATLAHDASDHLGRTISISAVLRALIRLAGARDVPLAAVVAMIERELQTGRKWGKAAPPPKR